MASLTLKPLSAKTRSPGSRWFKKLLCSVMNLSLVHPHPLEMNEMEPCGQVAIKYFIVWCDLYAE